MIESHCFISVFTLNICIKNVSFSAGFYYLTLKSEKMKLFYFDRVNHSDTDSIVQSCALSTGEGRDMSVD